MRKFKFFAMMLVIAVCAGFASCGDDDDDDDILPGADTLAGVWEESIPGYEFILTLNADGTGSIKEKGSVYTAEIEWTATDNVIRIYSESGDDYWYYRIKGGKLYLYSTREDYDIDDPSYTCDKTGNGGEQQKPGTGATGDLCNIYWRAEYYDSEDGHVYTTIYFHTDGTCTFKEEFKDYPEDNYKVTLSYSVEGNLSKGARLKMWGKTADGDPAYVDFFALLTSDNVLILEADGTCMEFTGTR